MAQKYYAAAKSREGSVIFDNWPECERAVRGYPGAVYKSFSELPDALNFLDAHSENTKTLAEMDDSLPTYYIDGSFSDKVKNYMWGVVMVLNGSVEESYTGTYVNPWPEALAMRNIAGEVEAALSAMKNAKTRQYSEINIVYDYQGIESWAIGAWKRRSNFINEYYEEAGDIMRNIKVNFIKVKGHTGNHYNEMVDELLTKRWEEMAND